MILKQYKTQLSLLCIMLTAFVMRFYHLSNSSLWLDELHTMNEADPSLTWAQLFDYLKCCDQHPPIFFMVERIMFTLFGYTEYVARVAPALAGIGCVWAMYRLGKELADEHLGLIAAAITSFSYFNIFYSQEARDYIFLWMFTALSFACFFRFAKSLKRADAIWYIISTILLLYSHYFSLLVIFCQLVIFTILWAAEYGNRKKFFLSFFIAEIVVLAVYLPWLPYLKEMSNIHSFWIQRPQTDFYYTYLLEFIGYAFYLLPFIYLALVVYCVNVFAQKAPFRDIKQHPLLLSFVFVFVSIVTSYVIMFVRSITVVPMMISRYAIVILPALFIAIAYGMYLVQNKFIRYAIICVFLFITWFDTVYVRGYYSTPQKEQFREITAFVAEEHTDIPVINELTGWHQAYYLKKMKHKGAILRGKKEDIVDSILAARTPVYTLNYFWIVGAHGDPHLDNAKRQQLDTAYTVIKQAEMKDVWAELYARKTLRR